MRRGSIFQLVVIGLLAGAIATAVALFVPWLPEPASRQAGRIDFVYWFATVISLFIFAVVAAILVYAVINFRAKPGDMSDGPPVHGHTTIEIIWTVIPALLVTSISVVSAIVLSKNGNAGQEPARGQGLRAAVRLDVPVPGREDLPGPATAARPPGQADDHLEGRDPLLLGPAVRPEAGRCAGRAGIRS